MYDTLKPYTKNVLDLIRETWQSPYVSVEDDVYPVIRMRFDCPIVEHTDGIGTKGYYHWNNKSFKNAAIDALAMNLNDLAMCGAEPFKIQNHIFLPEDDNEAIFEIVKALVYECKRRGIVITGGETSVHNNMNGMDISITMSGAVRNLMGHPLPKRLEYRIGDTLVGLPSSGLHSNGFTRVHETLNVFRPEFVEPTKIYLDEIREVYDCINALNHITGGAYTKLKKFVPGDADLIIKFNKTHQIFHDLAKYISSEEMYKTFNCGYGYVLSVPGDHLDYVLKHTDGDVIGRVVAGAGNIRIQSAFDHKTISL